MLQKDQSNITVISGDLVVKVSPRSDSVITCRQLNSIHKDYPLRQMNPKQLKIKRGHDFFVKVYFLKYS